MSVTMWCWEQTKYVLREVTLKGSVSTKVIAFEYGDIIRDLIRSKWWWISVQDIFSEVHKKPIWLRKLPLRLESKFKILSPGTLTVLFGPELKMSYSIHLESKKNLPTRGIRNFAPRRISYFEKDQVTEKNLNLNSISRCWISIRVWAEWEE